MFIDASAHFEKIKTHNYLREADINKIADTYKAYTCHSEQSEEAHEAIDKYSYVASLSEIQENDYNLNIPRYVDTFEEEDPVDLTTVSADLKQLDQVMKQVDNTIADFCNQLGINTPF